MRETAGRPMAIAARPRNWRRGRFIAASVVKCRPPNAHFMSIARLSYCTSQLAVSARALRRLFLQFLQRIGHHASERRAEHGGRDQAAMVLLASPARTQLK